MIKTEWDLKGIYGYSGAEDPQIEKDAQAVERAHEAFEKKYRGKKEYLTNDGALAKALSDYEKLAEEAEDGKPLRYFWFKKELNSEDAQAEAMIRKLEERFTKAGNRIQFFTLSLGKISATTQKKFLVSKKLEKYRYFLTRIFETAKHDLTEAEEKILALKNAPAHSMWVSGVEAVLSREVITFKGKKLPIETAWSKIRTIRDTKDRRELYAHVLNSLEKVSDFSESEINAVFTDKKIEDELRGFIEPYDATILGHETDKTAVLALVQAVTDHFHLAHRFYEIKRKILKLPYLTPADHGVIIGKPQGKFPFNRSVQLVRDAFMNVDSRYASIVDDFLANGQVDVFPKKGKAGGAYQSASYSLKTHVLLNHVDDFNSTMTLAHEMGHAIHSERSKATQPQLYWGYSTAVAETASTFFEGLAFKHVTNTMPESARLIILHDYIQDAIAAIFVQIAGFNFELALHRRVREEGWVPKQEIAALLNAHLQACYGKAIRRELRDGYFFIMWSHIRRPFYVYSYAYGELISRALRERVREDPTAIADVDKFLSAGGSKSPEDIFADIGIDVRKPDLFIQGLKSLERDIDELERLAKKA